MRSTYTIIIKYDYIFIEIGNLAHITDLSSYTLRFMTHIVDRISVSLALGVLHPGFSAQSFGVQLLRRSIPNTLSWY